jgi:hypothetical protein
VYIYVHGREYIYVRGSQDYIVLINFFITTEYLTTAALLFLILGQDCTAQHDDSVRPHVTKC